MDAKTAFFYLFSVILLFAAFRVITARNPVHAVLNLILAFSQAAGIWLLLRKLSSWVLLGSCVSWRGDGFIPVRGHDAGYKNRQDA